MEDMFKMIALARRQLHEQALRGSMEVRAALTTGVPIEMQGLPLLVMLFSARPASQTPQVQAFCLTAKVWDATAAKVAPWRSDRGSSSAGLGGEDLFLALRVAIAAAAPLASPAQSSFWFMRIGALLAFLRFVIGSLPLAGGEGLPLAVGPLVPWSAAPTSMGMPLPPLCISSVIRLSVHDCLRCHAAADATMLVALRRRALEISDERRAAFGGSSAPEASGASCGRACRAFADGQESESPSSPAERKVSRSTVVLRQCPS